MILFSGTSFDANNGIIGIADGKIYTGYDEVVFDWQLNKEDRHKVADVMIKQWTDFKNNLETWEPEDDGLGD